MGDTSSGTVRRADAFARYSTAAGVLAVALWVIARTLLVYLSSMEYDTEPRELDWTGLWVLAPAYICAALAVVLGVSGLRRRDGERPLAIVGMTIGLTFLVITLAEIPVSIFPYLIHPEPGPQSLVASPAA